MVNSLVPAFFIPGDKKERFLSFVRSVLANRWVSLTTLQRFAGKIISLSLAIPACKMYTREILAANAYLNKNNKQVIPLSPRLQEQLSYWLSLKTWQQCLPWRVERHSVITLHSDSSKGAWGAVVVQDGKKTVIRDYWTDSSPHINILEASALERALHSLVERVQNTRVDAWLDSQVVVTSWQREGGWSRELNDIFKRIVHSARQHNFELALHYLPSSSNPADVPSRTMSDLDCMLSPTAWSLVQVKFGPHSFDLCALDSNAWPTPQSAGVNVFAQYLLENHNLYVFPPIVLVGPFLRFLLNAAHIRTTIVVFDIYLVVIGGQYSNRDQSTPYNLGTRTTFQPSCSRPPEALLRDLCSMISGHFSWNGSFPRDMRCSRAFFGWVFFSLITLYNHSILGTQGMETRHLLHRLWSP